jgi:magnesium transporter
MEDFESFVLECIEEKKIEQLKMQLSLANENDIIDTLGELSTKNQVLVFRLLPKDKAFDVFEQLDTGTQEDLLNSFTDKQAIEIIEWLEPDDRVRLLDELPTEITKKMLAALSSEDRVATNLLMGFESGTAGRIMTPNFVRLKKNLTASEALTKVKRKAEDQETIYTLYVTDDRGKLEGVISLRDLLIASDNTILEDLMETEIISVATSAEQEDVARLLQKRDLLALPVVDNDQRIVGIITVDDAMDILEEEATDDILSKAGLAKGRGESCRSEAMIRGSLWAVWRVRMPFLFITLTVGLLAGSVMGIFEETLQQIIIAAMFIPVVMGMGGNVGVQSSTIFLRGALLGHINRKRIKRHIFRETLIGLSMGLVVGVVCGLAAFGFSAVGFMGSELTMGQSALLGLAVFLSLIIVMSVAATIGFVVPYILMRLNVDQAAATDPIITSIKDILGLLIYFGLVTLFLNTLIVI